MNYKFTTIFRKLAMLKRIKAVIINITVIASIFSICIEPAIAAESTKQSAMSGQIIMLAILFGGMYFLMIRPQSKRAKEHSNLLASLAKGDEVVTTGGLVGKVNKVLDQFLILVVADGVEVTVQKQAVTFVLQKGTIKSL